MKVFWILEKNLCGGGGGQRGFKPHSIKISPALKINITPPSPDIKEGVIQSYPYSYFFPNTFIYLFYRMELFRRKKYPVII